MTRNLNQLYEQEEVEETTVGRYQVREKLQIPSAYFINRGFSAKILDKYDVGDYKLMNRVFVPVYNNKYTGCVGWIARTIWEKCAECGIYHANDMVCNEINDNNSTKNKWINKPHFQTKYYLYNYWFAAEHIKKTRTAILVEGAGDVWKLEENGINIGLGIFGDALSSEQHLLLLHAGIHNIILAMDMDKAGRIAENKIINLLKRTHNVHTVELNKKDIGDTDNEEIVSILMPKINECIQQFKE